MLAASFAYACDNQTSTCDEDQPPDDPGDPGDPGDSGDPGDPGGGGGGEPGSPGNPIPLDPVVVTGNYDPLPSTPPPPDQYGGGGGGPADPGGRRVVKEIEGADRTTRRASQCYRNDNSFPFTATTIISYTQGVEVSASATASALSFLSAEFGLQVNSSITQTYNYSAVVPPGGTFAIYVTYQTNLYMVFTDSGPEEVVATVPIETTAGPC